MNTTFNPQAPIRCLTNREVLAQLQESMTDQSIQIRFHFKKSRCYELTIIE